MKKLELINVSKIYNKKVIALDNVSLTVNEGQFIAIMGQSGSGKSTLLQIAGLLDNCTSGSVIINGEDVARLDSNKLADVRKNSLGFVFQAFHLNSHLKVFENIMVPMLINDKFKNRYEMKERAMMLVKKVGLSHRSDHYPSELSGGEQQRVAIARALANEPDFILADEPTGNLDRLTGAEIMKLLFEAGETPFALVMVTHSQEAAALCGRTLALDRGRLS